MKSCENCQMPVPGRLQEKREDGTVVHADPAECRPLRGDYQRPAELVAHQELLKKYGSLSAAVEAGEVMP